MKIVIDSHIIGVAIKYKEWHTVLLILEDIYEYAYLNDSHKVLYEFNRYVKKLPEDVLYQFIDDTSYKGVKQICNQLIKNRRN